MCSSCSAPFDQGRLFEERDSADDTSVHADLCSSRCPTEQPSPAPLLGFGSDVRLGLGLDHRHRIMQTVTDTLQELAQADVQQKTVEVTRVPVNRVVETVPEIRTEGDMTIVPVLEAVLVVEKRLVLKEELRIRRRATTETVEVPVTLRKQRAVVERIDSDKRMGEE